VRLRALIFDVDGTLAETEELHRLAFNAAFEAHGVGWRWDRALYRDLLATAGGKERLPRYVASLDLEPLASDRLVRLVPEIHATKTAELAHLFASDALEPRTGIARLVGEARRAGIGLGIATTTTLANVEAIAPRLFPREGLATFDGIAAGDDVAHKKPAPDVYRLAVERLGLEPGECAAFEDSDLGVAAARAAGLFTIACPSFWTADHDLSRADLVLPTLGDPGRPVDPRTAERIGHRWLDLQVLERLHRGFNPLVGRETLVAARAKTP